MKMLPTRQTVWLLFVPVIVAVIAVMAFQLQVLREDVRLLQVGQDISVRWLVQLTKENVRSLDLQP